MKNYNETLINKDGTRIYRLNGEFHRTDGPAIIYKTGVKRWYIDGINLSKEDFIYQTKHKENYKYNI